MASEKDGGKRRRGGQPGMSGAPQGDFYARRLGQLGQADLEALDEESVSLQNEIALTRLALLKAMENLLNLDQAMITLEDAEQVARTSVKIATLLKAQRYLYGQTNQAGEAINLAIIQAARALGVIKEEDK